MTWIIAIYVLVAAFMLWAFQNAGRRRFFYALFWPLSILIFLACVVAIAIKPSDGKFNLENM